MKKFGIFALAGLFLGLAMLLTAPQVQASNSLTELTPIIAQDDDPQPDGGGSDGTCNDANEDGECDSSSQE